MKMENNFQGGWVIQNIEYKDDKLQNKLLITNTITFYQDKSCLLPIYTDEEYGNIEGFWDIKSKGGVNFLVIESSNEMFNGDIRIIKLQESISNGVKYTELQLETKKFKLYCLKYSSF